VRFGVVLRASVAEDAAEAEALGFDVGWIDASASPAPLTAAAFTAARTTGLRVVAEVECGPHPVALAEEAAVADLALAGRLVLALRSADAALLAETVDVIHQAHAASPFRHEGERWRVPAGLREHHDAEQRLRVTPAPAQIELPIWLAGNAAAAVAAERALSVVLDEDADGRTVTALADRLGPAALRLRRPAMRLLDSAFDPGALVTALRSEQAAWGMDVAVLRLAAELSASARSEVLAAVAHEVRPRVQLDALPGGLEADWRGRSFKQTVGVLRSRHDV
jgi:hypothetical protein